MISKLWTLLIHQFTGNVQEFINGVRSGVEVILGQMEGNIQNIVPSF